MLIEQTNLHATFEVKVWEPYIFVCALFISSTSFPNLLKLEINARIVNAILESSGVIRLL